MPQPPTVEVNGTAIRRIRLLSGRNLLELAAEAGITKAYLSRIETGLRPRLGPSVYARLRTALDATDEQLLAASEDRQQRTSSHGSPAHPDG